MTLSAEGMTVAHLHAARRDVDIADAAHRSERSSRGNLIEIIDLLETPQLARGDQILAIPTLVRKLPEPVRRIIGDLSNTERVLVGLNIRPFC